MPQNIPPWTIEIPVHSLGLAEGEEGAKALIIQSPAPNIQIVVPMPAEEVKELGEKLLAPRVQVASALELPGQ